jgi:hypothetical protein
MIDGLKLNGQVVSQNWNFECECHMNGKRKLTGDRQITLVPAARNDS